MTIQWFPGHMAKARREATEKMKWVDVVFELVDARLPLSSRNPMVDEIVGQKPRLIILNKADMADSMKTEAWLYFFQARGLKAVAVNAQAGKGLNGIVRAAKELLATKFEKMRAKGIRPRAIRAMIIGIPNVGKSTLINRLVKKKIAKTGDIPGVTKAQQWIKAGKELELLDTPGILWPKFEDPLVGYKLAVTGAVKDEILNFQDLVFYLLTFMSEVYPSRLQEVYQLETVPETPIQWVESIGKKRVLLGNGGLVDLDKAMDRMIRDVRTQKWGALTFEVPEDFAQSE